MHCNVDEEDHHTFHKKNAFGCDTACSDFFYCRKYVSENVAISNFLVGYFQEQNHLEREPSSKVSQSLVVKNPVARIFLDVEYQAITFIHSPYRHQCNWKRLATTTFTSDANAVVCKHVVSPINTFHEFIVLRNRVRLAYLNLFFSFLLKRDTRPTGSTARKFDPMVTA